MSKEQSIYKNKKVLVAGGTGLIGRPLVEMLIAERAKVRIASLDNPLLAHPEAEFLRGNLTNWDFCKKAVKGMNYVFNLAGTKGAVSTGATKAASFFVPHLVFNTLLMEAARLEGVDRYLYTSTIGIYPSALEPKKEDIAWEGPPCQADRFAGWAKRMGELQAEAYKLEFGWDKIAIIRPAHCFSEDTHVLTPDGIKNIKDFSVGDKVYTLNIQTQRVEIDTVINIIKEKTNEIIKFKGRSLDWEVTKDHKMFLSTNDNKPKFIKAEDLLGKPSQRYLVQHSPIKNGESPERISLWRWVDNEHLVCLKTNMKYRNTDLNKMGFKSRHGNERYYEARKSHIRDVEKFKNEHKCKIFIKDFLLNSHYSPLEVPMRSFLKVLAWYMTEGNASSRVDKSSQINIAQQQRKYRGEIIKAIKDMGFNPAIGKKSISFTSRIFKNMIIEYGITSSKEKSIPNFIFNLNLSLRKLFLETLMKGDGHREGNRYTTISKKLAEDIFHLAFTCGKQPLLREKIEKNKKMYRIYFRKKRTARVIKPGNISLKKVNRKKVYCITARNNHVIFAGRNGFFGWIGQCYGPYDYFDPSSSMVVPSLIRRAVEKENPFIVWGDGSAVRDFVYTDDVAEGMLLSLEHAADCTPINLGSGVGVTIKELVEVISSFIPGLNIQWDTSKPGGEPVRVLDISRAKERLGWKPKVSLKEGIGRTIEWYEQNKDNLPEHFNVFYKKELIS